MLKKVERCATLGRPQVASSFKRTAAKRNISSPARRWEDLDHVVSKVPFCFSGMREGALSYFARYSP